MKRKDKYPDTDTFHWHNANPKGRLTSDCAYRAISTATGIDYNEVVRGMAEIHCSTGYEPTRGRGLDAYMKKIGWVKHSQPRHRDGTKYTGEDFCVTLSMNERKEYGNILCNIGGNHMVAIVPTCEGDGINDRFKVCDTWNSTYGCIGNYWTKG